MSKIHETFMRRCFQIAENGLGSVAPNPLVGCVIVHNGKIISEGIHLKYGENHAERNAILRVNDEKLLQNSTLYVNLEPCSHFGKTPPCADLIIEKKIPRVVVSNLDSNPEVAGRGIARLRNAGIAVTTGILEDEGRFLNRRFFTYIEKKRPYIILKWAESLDGFMWSEDERYITNAAMQHLVHKWRSEEPAIMVGTNTVLQDNPKLNVRAYFGRNPLRITIDQHQKFSKNFHKNSAEHSEKNSKKTLHFLDHSQPTKIYETPNLSDILEDLHAQKIQSLIVEGGAKLLQSFIEKNLWDEVRVLIGNKHLRKGLRAPEMPIGTIFFDCELENDRVKMLTNSNKKSER